MKTKQIKHTDFESLKKFIVKSFKTNEKYFLWNSGREVLSEMDNTIIGAT